MSDIPEWAIERACDIVNKERGFTAWISEDVRPGAYATDGIIALARYIAEHEEPPVDPLLGVVEEAIAGTDEKSLQQLHGALAERGFKIVPVQS